MDMSVKIAMPAPAVILVTAPPEKACVDSVFSCYDKKVVVSVTDAIGEPVNKEEP